MIYYTYTYIGISVWNKGNVHDLPHGLVSFEHLLPEEPLAIWTQGLIVQCEVYRAWVGRASRRVSR